MAAPAVVALSFLSAQTAVRCDGAAAEHSPLSPPGHTLRRTQVVFRHGARLPMIANHALLTPVRLSVVVWTWVGVLCVLYVAVSLLHSVTLALWHSVTLFPSSFYCLSLSCLYDTLARAHTHTHTHIAPFSPQYHPRWCRWTTGRRLPNPRGCSWTWWTSPSRPGKRLTQCLRT